MNDFNYDNEIIEIGNENNQPTFEELVKEEIKNNSNEKKNKKKFNLTKQQKTIFIIIGVLVILLIICIVLFFVLKKEEKEEPKDEPIVILEKDNYRYENGKLIFINASEKEIGSYECENKDTEKCFVTKINLDKDTFDRSKNVNENGEEIIKNSKIYHDKYVFVTDGDIIYLYNMIDNTKELELQNIKIYNTSRNVVIIEDDNSLYGLIEITNEGYEYLIRCSYNNLGIVNTDKILLLAQDKDKNYIIDSDGETLSKNIKVEVRSANELYIVGYVNDTYNLYSYDYEELLSDYDYIGLHDEVISLVKNKRLYILNNNLSKLYEDGIRLENTNYNKKYVYNSDNRLIETLKSYELEINNNTLTISVNNSDKLINMVEGEISSNLSYMSYFDGKLYFYSDEEKLDLIGTYNCTNKNNVVNIEDTLKSCNIYVNELGASGIYNNQYVFISENDGAVTNYYLYDLKENKVKGTYSELILITENDLGLFTKPIYTSSSFIIAKSAVGTNKGNYGVLEITGEKVQGKIDFKYLSIVNENGYYLLKNIDNTYSIYKSDFTKISNEFEYIKLYEKYYVGINNNKLNVYSYTNTLGILENDLTVTDTNYEIDFKDGFKITINGEGFNYDKYGKKIVLEENENDELEELEGENNGE